jgi:tetratricopeptide (TPR) repeat protein
MKPFAATWLAAILIAAPFAAAADIQALEARLKDHLAASPEAAELMLELLQQREAAEDVFGVIKTAGDFVRAQTKHPKRAEVMVRLIEGYTAGARHAEVITTGKQFFELFPDSPLATRAHQSMADACEKLGRWQDAARHWAAIALTGDAVAVKQALELFRRAENAQAGREGAEFTTALLRKFPSEAWSAPAAMRGMELAGRGERWETGAEIARLALKGTHARTPAETAALWFRLGEFESRLGRHSEAVAAIEKSLAFLTAITGAHTSASWLHPRRTPRPSPKRPAKSPNSFPPPKPPTTPPSRPAMPGSPPENPPRPPLSSNQSSPPATSPATSSASSSRSAVTITPARNGFC